MWIHYLTSAAIGFGVATFIYILPRMYKQYQENNKQFIQQVVIEYLKELQKEDAHNGKPTSTKKIQE